MKTNTWLWAAAVVLLATGIIRADTQYESAKLTASDPTAFAAFGQGVAIDGDWAAAGAPYSGSVYEPGSVYFYKRNGQTWTQTYQAVSTQPGWDQFGTVVDISGDWAVIGAPRTSAGAMSSGAAYIYHRSGNTWTQFTELTDPSPSINEYFGTSVSIHGNLAIVGGYWQHAAIYQYDGSSWNLAANLKPSDASKQVCFGHAVAISDNYAVVASPEDTRHYGSIYNGAAYVFKRQGSSWVQMAKIKASDSHEGNYFGDSVAVSDNRLVIGASQYPDYSKAPGAAYVFDLQNGSWQQTQKLTPSNGGTSDRFGCSVALDGNDVVIGAYNKRADAVEVGAAYWYQDDGGIWTEQSYLQPSGPAQMDGYAPDLGYHVDLANGTAIAGQMFTRLGEQSCAGAAFIYNVPEPATVSLLCLGGLALISKRRKRSGQG